MKKINFITLSMILFIMSCKYCSSNIPPLKDNTNSFFLLRKNFEYHLNILDSVANKDLHSNSFICCKESIKFMEINTNIEADGTLLGKIMYSREDLEKWHSYYNKMLKDSIEVDTIITK